jgi:hypothetical protein
VKTLLACVILFAIGAAPTTYPYREERRLDNEPVQVSGFATLSTQQEEVTPSDVIAFEVQFHNEKHGAYIYNPFFSLSLPPPAALAVFDIEHRYVGDYLATFPGGWNQISSASWVFIPSGGVAGAKIARRAGAVVKAGGNRVTELLKPGEYDVQAIYYNAFAGYDSKAHIVVSPEDGALLQEHFDQSELLRSNAVRIRIKGNETGTESVSVWEMKRGK